MKYFIPLFILFSGILYAQNDYKVLLDQVIYEVETNYSGFIDKTVNNEDYYNYYKKKLLRHPVENVEGLKEQIRLYLAYFSDNHLYISNKKKRNAIGDFKLESIDENTTYLSLPSFRDKSKVDSLINNYAGIILSKNNLIIDLRKNSGGTDDAFSKLLPIIATNDIYVRNIDLFASKDNCRLFESVYNQTIWSEDIDRQFIPFPFPHLNDQNRQEYYLKTYEVTNGINEFPKHIAVLVDRYVASSGEQFVICAKQSNKVKIFGENTSGSLDYSNLRPIEIIADQIYLYLPTTKLRGLPINSIDKHGITPDFYLNSENQIDQIMKYFEYWN